MSVSNRKKKYIQAHYPRRSVKELAKALNLSPDQVEQVLQELRLKPEKAIVGVETGKSASQLKLGLSLGIIIFLAFLVYLPALSAGFIADDHSLILKNPLVIGKDPIWKSFTSEYWSITGRKSSFYRPLTTLSYWLDYKFYQEKSIGFHLTNILLHIFCSGLVFLCIYQWCGNYFLALITGLSFALHPAHTQSVSWISGRTDVLATFFMLTSFYFYLFSKIKTSSGRFLILSALFFFFSLLSKELAIVFPILIILLDLAQERKVKLLIRKHIKFYLSFFVVICFYLLLRYLVLGEIEAGRNNWLNWYPGQKLDVSRVATIFKVYCYYLKTLLYPINLCFESKLSPSSLWLDPKLLSSLVIILLVIFFSGFAWFRLPYLGTGLSWFFVSLLPVSQIIALPDLTMEHFLYLPSIGFSVALAVIVENAHQFLSKKFAPSKFLAPFLLGIIMIFYSGLTWQRNFIYHNELRLWADVSLKAPERKHGEKRIARSFYEKGDKRTALKHFRRAIIADARDYEAYFYVGKILAELGETQKAVEHYQTALNINPHFSPALLNLAELYLDLILCDDAKKLYQLMKADAPPDFAQRLNQKCPR